jgi:hypothetical protein
VSDIKLGTKPSEGALRDAIHVAIAPMIAGTPLAPGAHVGILPDGTAGMSDKPIGIVDPFIGGKVHKGELFWLLLYQNTVTVMRHHWSHPAFITEPVEVKASSSLESEAWLIAYARTIGTTFEDLINTVVDGYIVANESHSCSDVDPEFAHHYEVVTGKKCPADVYFSCSC